ncbi:MAG TPA: ABC transporter ATP-binding protein, partial [Gammaproteobacteria bacterium]|nr:ABC transporter ATP-binding protein [Gammaproteobacteria bacterium]
MGMLSRIMALLENDAKRAMPAVFLYGLGASVFEMVGLGMLPVFVQLLADPNAAMSVPYVKPVVEFVQLGEGSALIYFGCAVLVGFFFLKTLYMIRVYHVQARFTRDVMVGIGNRMFDNYLYAPYTFHLHVKSGDIIRNVTHAPQYFAASIVLSLLKVFLHGVITLGILLLLLVVHPQTTLVALIVPAAAAWGFMVIIKRSTLRHGRALQEALGVLTSLTNQALGSIKETHVSGCYDYLRRHFKHQMERIGAAHQFQKFAPMVAKPVMEMFGVLVLVILILIVVLRGESLSEALPVIVLFLAAIARLIQNIFPVTQSLTSLRSYSYLIDLLENDIRAVEHERESLANRYIPASITGDLKDVYRRPIRLSNDIEIRQLSFRYPKSDRDAITNISLSIPHQSAVALVGASGSGKTTLLDLILGLLSPNCGEILVDGVNIHGDLRSWQKDIGYIPQTIYLMDESIRQNVAFGEPHEQIDDERVWEVLRVAQIDAFVKDLPEGLDTNVGERGVRISGGQRQRIGIARALYHNPDVLILDEATSALDTATERAVMKEIAGF